MRIAHLYWSLVLAAVPVMVGAQPSAVSLIAEGRDNVMQRWEVSPEKWRAQSKWNPSLAGQPPLPIAKAVELAEAWLRKRHTDVSKMALSQVVLRTQTQSGYGVEDHWFYRVEFQPMLAGRKVWGADLVAVVLFDGTVVVPQSEPYTSPMR
jgi:hypothetical protein